MRLSEIAEACLDSYLMETEMGFINYSQMLVTKSQEDNRAIVSFRGSDERQDWFLTNLKWELTNPDCLGCTGKGVKVHQGFDDSYHGLKDAIDKLLDDEDEVVFTGHSMGGCLAMLGCLHFLNRHPDRKAKVITFGSPKLGNELFCAQFLNIVGASNLYRFRHEWDFIPCLPPRIPFVKGYEHPMGGEVVIKYAPILEAHSIDTYVDSAYDLDFEI